MVTTEGMRLSEALESCRSAIVDKWLERILETYPESTTRFLLQERDPFQNPVGYNLKSVRGTRSTGRFGIADPRTG